MARFIPTFNNPHVTARRWNDRQYGAAFLLFTRVPRAARYVDEAGIDKSGLLKASRAWSHGEQILIKAALDLFDPGCVSQRGFKPAGFGEAVGVLDDENLDAVLNAIRVARGQVWATDLAAYEKGE